MHRAAVEAKENNYTHTLGALVIRKTVYIHATSKQKKSNFIIILTQE